MRAKFVSSDRQTNSVPNGIVAIVPVKALAAAKSRLGGRLTPDEREALVLRLLDGVLIAVRAAPGVERCLVVSPDARVRERTCARGAVAIDERETLSDAGNWSNVDSLSPGARASRPPNWATGGRDARAPSTSHSRAAGDGALPLTADDVLATGSDRGYNAALEAARVVAIERWQPSALLVLAADLPRLTADDVTSMIALGTGANRLVVAPDRWETGTNGLLLRPPGAIPFRFGPGSFAAHLREAAKRGLDVQLYQAPGTAFDVDEPRDLEAIVS